MAETVLHPKIRKLRDIPTTTNMLVMGESKTGKTTFAVTAPKPLFLNVESGLDSVRDHPDLEVWDIQSVQDLMDAHKFLLMEKHHYESVVLDSLSEMYYGPIMSYVIQHPRRGQNEDPDLAGLRDYQRAGDVLRKIVRMFRDMPLNTIIISAEKEVVVEGRLMKSVQLSGNAAKEIPYQFDIVGYTYVTTGGTNVQQGAPPRYFMRIKPHENLVANLRMPYTWANYLPTTIENPTWEKLMRAIDEAKKQAEAAGKKPSAQAQ